MQQLLVSQSLCQVDFACMHSKGHVLIPARAVLQAGSSLHGPNQSAAAPLPPSPVYKDSCEHFSWPLLEPQVPHTSTFNALLMDTTPFAMLPSLLADAAASLPKSCPSLLST